MEDEKKYLNDEKEEVVLEKQSSQSEYTQSELNEELEKLAQTFRDELKKASELSQEEFEEAYADELGIIPDEELCECCGERRKDKAYGESYQYCSVCRENMKRYPLSVSSIFIAIMLVAVAVSSIFTFTQDFYGYDLMYKARTASKEGKLSTALSYYDRVIEEFSGAEINPKNAYLESAEIISKNMDDGMLSMSDISDRINNALTEFEFNLPIYYEYVGLREESIIQQGTLEKFYEIVSKEEYADFSPENEEMYKEIMTEIGSLIDEEIGVLTTDGEKTFMMPADKSIVRFCQYMFAYTSEQYEDAYKYIKEAEELAPDEYWLYAYELGMVELQWGKPDEAKELAQALLNENKENPDAYVLYTSIYRMAGKYNNAVKWANKGIEIAPDNSELLRYKAMALCADGELEEAKKAIDEALNQEYGLVYFTAIVIENELGNDDTVKEYKARLKEENVEFSDRMKDYLKGKITAVELFTEGTGDVQ